MGGSSHGEFWFQEANEKTDLKFKALWEESRNSRRGWTGDPKPLQGDSFLLWRRVNFIISSARNHWRDLSRKMMCDLVVKDYSGCSMKNGSWGCGGCGGSDLKQSD